MNIEQRAECLAPPLGNIAMPKRLVVAGFVIAGVVLVLVLAALVERFVYRGRILPGVAVARVHVAGDGERAALRAIEPAARAANTRAVRVRANGKQFALDPRSIGYRANARQTVRDAREVGRSRNPMAQIEGVVLGASAPTTSTSRRRGTRLFSRRCSTTGIDTSGTASSTVA